MAVVTESWFCRNPHREVGHRRTMQLQGTIAALRILEILVKAYEETGSG